MRSIAIAASVAAFRDFNFDIAGSNTPAAKLSRTTPLIRSIPELR
jgi:hypothetical protein